MAFHDRREAGRVLASRMGRYAGRADVLVLALPRGGVPVAFEVAQVVRAPLDVFLVRKLGAPGHEELALPGVGCASERRPRPAAGDLDRCVETVTAREARELRRRETAYRGSRPGRPSPGAP
jgi:predicted phosphoribosyltransferase